MLNPSSDLLMRALTSWREWNCAGSVAPQLIKKVPGGLTNQHYLFECGSSLVVLRLHNLRSSALGINRVNERRILEALAPSGIAPKLRYWSPQNDFSVCDYLAGRVWTRRDFINTSQKMKLQKIITQYQHIQPEIPVFDYHQHLLSYWRQLTPQKKFRIAQKLGSWQRFSKRLRCYELHHRPRVLVHHDLNPSNIVERDERLHILDWEYAGMGYSALDYLPFISQNHYRSSSCVPNQAGLIKQMHLWLSHLWWAIR